MEENIEIIDDGGIVPPVIEPTPEPVPEPIPGPTPLPEPVPAPTPYPIPDSGPDDDEVYNPKPKDDEDDMLGSLDCRSECKYNTGDASKRSNYGYSD